MRFTIRDQDHGLCTRCKNSQVVRFADGHRRVICHWASPTPVLRAVAECSKFTHVNQPEEHEMRMIAWNLKVENGRVIGFKAPGRRTLEDGD